MPTISIGQRLDRALLAHQLAAQGPAVDYGRVVVSTSPEKGNMPPTPDLAADRWAALVDQFVTRLECAFERAAAGERVSRRMSWQEMKAALPLLAGFASEFVGCVLQEPVERVREVRAALGTDAETGLNRPKPLTAPIEDQLEAWSDRLSEGYEWAVAAWEEIYTPEAVYGLERDHDDPPRGAWSPTEGAGVSDRRYYENYAAPARGRGRKDATSPDVAPPFAGD
jgi:hypothetical protein